MFKYAKLIIFILILILVSTAVLLIDSSVDNMNKLMPEISDGIVNGNRDYNESVNFLNSRNFNQSMQKALSAEENYNSSIEKLYYLKNSTTDVNSIHKHYINATVKELELKLEAVGNLKESINYLKVNSNYTGTNYASKANDYIQESLRYQNMRDSLVNENPKLFKQNFII